MTLYSKIVETLEARRQSLNAPLPLPDEHGLAAEFSVSRRTVRTALQLLESRGAVTRRRRAGTFLQPLRIHSDGLFGKRVGIVPPWWAVQPNSWYYSVILDGVSRWTESHACAFSVLHAAAHPINEHRWLENIRRLKLEAILWVQPQADQLPLLAKTAELFPTIVLGRVVTGNNLHCVAPDFSKASELIDHALRSHGHVKYALVGKDLLSPFTQSWIDGFKGSWQEHGEEFDYRQYYIDYSFLTKKSVSSLLLDLYLRDHPEVQALVFPSSGNLDFLSADKRFCERMQSDLSVVTSNYGSYPIESIFPGTNLTHIAFDWSKMAGHALDKLALLVEGKPVPMNTREPVRLVAGDSVHRLPSGPS